MQKHVFVARGQQLSKLEGFLDQALESRGLVCFVAGEAGSGKTTLVSEFARRAQARYEDLTVAVGQSDVQTGLGDAMLPFREVLGQLTGDFEAKLAQGAMSNENAGRLQKLLRLSGQALVEVGPDLIGVFLPGAGLASRVGAFVAEKSGWLNKLEGLANKQPDNTEGIEQNHIFEQYANVLCRLSEKHPLVLVLDDLHWADEASMSLLFRLSRRISNHRILVIGTFRPEEVAIGRLGERHPLEKVLAELKRYFGDIRIDLDQIEHEETILFVNDFLNSEPNLLGEDFRRKLIQHTNGHPLFTVELLRAMQERGDLVQDVQGRWVQASGLDWGSLPERVEGVIEERIGRLEQELHQILSIGSVEGEDFTAEVIAHVQASDLRAQVRHLSVELEKQHRLVQAKGVRRLDPGGQRLSQYRFHHNLFRTYLYGQLDDIEKVYLHEDVGTALEELYGEQSDEILVQLALHFVEAGNTDKAIDYLVRAGEQMARRFANSEAARFFSQAITLMPGMEALAGQPQKLKLCYRLHLAREDVYAMTGDRQAQSRDLSTLCRLAEMLNDDSVRAEVSLREARYYEMMGDYPAALTVLNEGIESARSAQDISQEARALQTVGFILWRKGDYKDSLIQSERALDLARSSALQEVEARALHNLAVSHWRLGESQEGRAFAQQCLEISLATGNRRTLTRALGVLGNIHLGLGELEHAGGYYEQSLHNHLEMGDLRGQAMDQGNLGIIAEIQGDFSSAGERFEQVRAIFHDMGDKNSEARALAHIGLGANIQGLYEKSRDSYQAALKMYCEIGDRQGQVWVLTMTGRLLNLMGDPDQASMVVKEALNIAQELGVYDMEASAWTALGNIYVSKERLADAQAAYTKGLNIHREQGNEMEQIGATAGLARVALARGDHPQAAGLVDEILQFAENHPIQGTADEPYEIYLTCYQVLRAREDQKANEVLKKAHQLLQEQAARISDPAMRCSFLENVPANRAIVQEFLKTGLQSK